MAFPIVPLYRKGDVFFVHEPAWVTQEKMKSGSYSITKTRPYVIVTSDAELRNNPKIIQMLPITSSVDTTGGKDVIFSTSEKQFSRIKMSQIYTIDVSDLRNYVCHLTDELIAEVDFKLANQLGLGDILIKMAKEVTNLEAQLETAKNEAAAVIANFTLDLTEKETKVKAMTKNIQPEIPEDLKPKKAQVVETPLPKEVPPKTTVADPIVYTSRSFKGRPPRSWKLSQARAYIADYDDKRITQKSIGEKYDVKPGSVAGMYDILKKRVVTYK